MRLHCDAHDIELVEQTKCASPRKCCGCGAVVSCTLPGRWRRSVDDAQWAIEHRLPVRVVKGQWADPADPDSRPEGRILGSHRPVGRPGREPWRSPRTTSRWLLEAISRLEAAGTPCTWELLYGLPMRAAAATGGRARHPGAGLCPLWRRLYALCPGQIATESAHCLVVAQRPALPELKPCTAEMLAAGPLALGPIWPHSRRPEASRPRGKRLSRIPAPRRRDAAA